eukprot:4541776-Amphidinium_carterae.1
MGWWMLNSLVPGDVLVTQHSRFEELCMAHMLGGCPHGKLRYECAVCAGCEHGKAKHLCAACNSCPHGRFTKHVIQLKMPFEVKLMPVRIYLAGLDFVSETSLDNLSQNDFMLCNLCFMFMFFFAVSP